LLEIAEAQLILYKDNVSRMQSSLLEIAEAQLILYKDNVSRMQSSLLEIAEAQLILYKDKINRVQDKTKEDIFYVTRKQKVTDYRYTRLPP